MNYFAYRSTGFAVRAVTGLSKARIRLHGQENIPEGALIFVANHFTRIETFFLTETIFQLTRKKPVWSLASAALFDSGLGRFLTALGAVSTRNPDRDRLIVKSLLTGEASWIIYPEGRMVKNKKIFENKRYLVSHADGQHSPHSGAATLALRTQFYRQRLRAMADQSGGEAERLMGLFELEDIEPVLACDTFIVPVNITYYPLRARENMIQHLAEALVDAIPEHIEEEIMTEGTMLIEGVDIDIRFGQPIAIDEYTDCAPIARDIASKQPFGFDDPIASRQTLRREALKILRRYMSAIYGMTTINPDHLFAAMLRLMPVKKMGLTEFKQRLYLAFAGDLKSTGVHCHFSLARDPVDLLTDDRHGRFGDFLNLAAEKGIVTIRGDRIEKDTARLAANPLLDPAQWHRMRLDNPIAVMANEVEPLTGLRRYLRPFVWLPAFSIKRRIFRRLIEAADREFNQDYEAFFIDGESKAKSIGRPFLLRGRSRRFGILLAHGYMAAPAEVRELAEYLKANGYWVYAPRIRGHGTAPEDLALRTCEDWVASMDAGYAVINSVCRRVVVGGFSNGAGLALDAASRIKDVAGVFAISPPLKLQNYTARFAPALDMWNRLMDKVGQDAAKKEFVDNAPENPRINYLRNPVAGVKELDRFMDRLEPRLAGITAPAMVIQSVGDPVVDEKGSRLIFERLGSAQKKYILFNYKRHGIVSGDDARWVHRCVRDFLEELQLMSRRDDGFD